MSTDLSASPQDAAEIHRYAEALLSHLAANGSAPPPLAVFPDVADYWLPPAVEALVAILSGEDPFESLTKAAARDQQNTALFLCLALAVAGHGDRVHASWIGTAFGDLAVDRPVTHGQRSLWLAAARGAYGPAGKIFVLRRLDALAVPAQADVQQWLQALAPGEPSVVVPPSLVDYPELAEIAEVARPAQAAARLARLCARCAEVTSTKQADHESRTPLTNGKAVPATTWAEDEPLAVLRTLVGLGGPAGPMGSLTSHLLDDLRPGADPHLAAIALHVAAPMLRGVAAELTADTQLAPPESVTVAILGHRIKLRPEGPGRSSIAEAERAIIADGSTHPQPRVAWALLLVAVGCLVGAFTVTLLAVAGLSVGALAAWLLWRRYQAAGSNARHIAMQIGELKELADGAVWALHAYAREADARTKQAAEDSTELTRLLRRGPRAA